jgi:hypothetical protein
MVFDIAETRRVEAGEEERSLYGAEDAFREEEAEHVVALIDIRNKAEGKGET